MRTVSPASLENICLSFICTNIEDLCREYVDDIEYCGFPCPRLRFISPIFLHEQLAESIMKGLSCNGKLTTRTASLFSDPKSCRIRKFDLRETNIDYNVVRYLFTQHKVLKLDLHGTAMPSSLLDELLNMVSLTLRELNLSYTAHVLDFCTVRPLSCLTHLDIIDTAVTDDEMSRAAQHLNCLEYVNISNTAISETISFGNLRGQLKTLLAYNAPVAWNNPVEFREFKSLQILDISRNPDNMRDYDWPSHAEKVEEMLGDQHTMPELVYLDVSGTPRIMDDPLQTFLNSHLKLRFLGLCKTGLTSHAKWLPTNIEITGEGNEQQILSSMQAYPDRASYMTEALRGLFHFSKNWTERKPEVLQLVLSPMEKHAEDLRVQMATTACVFNIIRGGGTEEDVHPTYLSKIASLVISAMSSFPDKNDLLRNCLLILETRQLLRKAKFNYFEAASRAMDALCFFSSDENIPRLAIKVCAILSSKDIEVNLKQTRGHNLENTIFQLGKYPFKRIYSTTGTSDHAFTESVEVGHLWEICTSETSSLGSERNILKLLNIVQEKISLNEAGFTLSLGLSVLWNFTDEAPSTCLLFVQKGGLHMAAQGLVAFREGIQEQHITVKKKILGTLNNIAEVPELRKYLITNEFMDLFGSLLENQLIQLSYFAGGILSNVLLEWADEELLPLTSKQLMLQKLEEAVMSWELPSEELVAYRSFNPFVELLHSSMPAVQMWALWGMLHVCSRSAKRYIPLLVEEDILASVEQIIDPSFEGVSQLAQKLVDAVKNFQLSGK